jgi:hypothetical protein
LCLASLEVSCGRSISIEDRAESAEYINVSIEQVTQVQFEKAVMPIDDLLLEQLVKFSIFCPPPVLFQDLGETGPLSDLEAR